jgi:hypothetical protein
MTYDVVKMGDNTYQTSAVASQFVVMSNRSSYSIPNSRFTTVDTRPEETASPLDSCRSESLERPFLFLHRGYRAEPGEFPIFSLASTAAQDRDVCAHVASLVQAADAHPMGDSK